MVRGTALLLTVLTGFSGLVYEVVWQQYLATLLGSHSEATAAVLGIFLGGLSLGYALFGRICRALMREAARRNRPPDLLLLYGAVESAIGIYGVLFPLLFAGLRALSLQLPHVSDGVGFAVDVILTVILIGPPTILMGGTIPLLTQGLSRRLDDATRFHAMVYAFNTSGAFVGALAAGFILVPWLGLKTTVCAMGLVNLAAGVSFLLLHRREHEQREHAPRQPGEAAAPAPSPSEPAVAVSPTEGRGSSREAIAFGVVALLAGFGMMTVQTVLNRMGALALGASQFTFSMVVATFVLCIALGSFAVSALRRVRTAYLIATQWLLVALLLALHWLAEDAPYWAHTLRTSFSSDPSDFYPFHFAVFAAILAIFCVPLGLSGALLPLIFHRLRRASADLGRTAGRIYSWNTLGSLLGALIGGYLLLFWFEIDDTYRMAVFALAGAAAVSTGTVARRARVASLVAFALVGTVLATQPGWDPRKLSAGLFRHRTANPELAAGPGSLVPTLEKRWTDDYIRFYDDDPSTSVAVFDIAKPGDTPRLSIINNGKSDGNIPHDNMTAGLLALLPALFAEKCERAFVIGYGTGMSVGELAALDDVEEVVVAEISRGVVRAAPLFEEMNRQALASPKTHLIRSDAYRTLMRGQGEYDVIVSEPSNPWVTGVEMLYSLEFLEAALGRLAPGGVYAQWFHAYETDDRSVALVLNTFRTVFPRTSVWLGRAGDLILLGFEDAEREVDLAQLESRWQRPDFNRQLKALPLKSFPRLLAHEILPLGVPGELSLPERVHTILHPTLSHDAARAFFAGGTGKLPENPTRPVATIGARNSLVGHYRASRGGTLPDDDRLELMRETCNLRLALCATLFAQWIHEDPDSEALATSLQRTQASPKLQRALQPGLLIGLALLFRDEADPAVPNSFEYATDLTLAFLKYYHHAAPFSANALHESWRRCAQEDSRCAAQLETALAIGQPSTRLSQR